MSAAKKPKVVHAQELIQKFQPFPGTFRKWVTVFWWPDIQRAKRLLNFPAASGINRHFSGLSGLGSTDAFGAIVPGLLTRFRVRYRYGVRENLRDRPGVLYRLD